MTSANRHRSTSTISIHVLRVEDDRIDVTGHAGAAEISIHVLRVEDDVLRSFRSIGFRGFQSTSSVWRTTWLVIPSPSKQRHFNPRPPCGGRHHTITFSTIRNAFQSTSSVWRTTLPSWVMVQPREDFNPRPPCGGRPWERPCILSCVISIHVLRVEDDLKPKYVVQRRRISIHVLRVEDDLGQFLGSVLPRLISIHVLRVEDDSKNAQKTIYNLLIIAKNHII